MNRYDILLGKAPSVLERNKMAPPLPECNKKVIIGGRGSGKTTALLNLLSSSIDSGVYPILSVKRDHIHRIRNRLGGHYQRCKIVHRFDERGIQGTSHLFLDDVETYLHKLPYIFWNQHVVATCDEEVFLSYSVKEMVPGNKMCIIGNMKWEIKRVRDLIL